MLELSYYMPVKICFGYAAVERNSHLLKNYGTRTAIITGSLSAAKSGALSDIVAAINKNGQTFQIFSGVKNDPPIENVMQMASEINLFKPDYLIAIGGGSVIDAAKAIALLLTNSFKEEILWQKDFIKPLPLIAIPTTAGTGSEVTPYAILTDNKLKTKRSVSSEEIYPKVAFCDPFYTESMAKELTINTAVDALSHLLEGFFAKRANNISDLYALKGLEFWSEGAPGLFRGEMSKNERESLMAASLFGGLTIAKTGTTMVHALGYSLTYDYKIPHGKANGLLLNAYLDFMLKTLPEKTKQALKTLGYQKITEFQDDFKQLFSEKLKLSTREIAFYVEKALKTSNVVNTPGKVSAFVLADIIERSLL